MAVPWPLPLCSLAGAYLASHKTRWYRLACSLRNTANDGLRLCSCIKTAATPSLLCSFMTECMHCWNLS